MLETFDPSDNLTSPTDLHYYLPTYQPTYIPTYHPPTHLPGFPFTHLPSKTMTMTRTFSLNDLEDTLKEQSWRLVTFETLLSFLTIENDNLDHILIATLE